MLVRLGDLYIVLDMVKVVDIILFFFDLLEGWDSIGDYCFFCFFVQGFFIYILVVQGIFGFLLKK